MAGIYRHAAPPRRARRQLAPPLIDGAGSRAATVSVTLAPAVAAATGRCLVRAASARTLASLAGAAAARCLVRATSSRTLASLAGAASAASGGARNASVAQTLHALEGLCQAATGIWTLWQPIAVVLHPGSIWDDGATLWDGASDVYDNDGAIWDPGSPFAGLAPPAGSTWVPGAAGQAQWVEPLR
jgi:hypothetical protein